MDGRFGSFHSQIYLGIFICLLLLFIFRVVIIELLVAKLYKVLTCDCCRKHRDKLYAEGERKYTFSEDIFNEMEIGNLQELYKRSCKDLDEYKDLMKTHDCTALKMDEKMKDKHMDQLKARILHIERSTDNHLLRLLKGNAKAPNPTQKAKYMAYNINDKHLLLVAN